MAMDAVRRRDDHLANLTVGMAWCYNLTIVGLNGESRDQQVGKSACERLAWKKSSSY